MGVFNRKGTVRDGLVLELDAANQKSWGADQTKWKDTTSQGNDGTLTNGPVHSQGPFPGAGYVTFDGTDDYLTTTYSTSEFRWWDTDYTIEAWIYPTTLTDWYDGSARPALVGNMDHTGMTNYWSFGPYNSSGNINFYYWNGSAQDAMVSTESVTANSWNHIAFIKNSSGCKIFVNGVGTNYMAISGTPQDSTSYNLTVGAYYNSDINGYVSNLRIVKGTALYTSNFTPQLSELTAVPNTKLLTCQKGTITDASVSGHSITVTGNAAAVYNDVSYFDFDGNDDYVDLGTINTSHVLQMNNPSGGGLTLSWWGYFDDTGDDFQRIFDKSNNSTAANGWAIYTSATGSNTTTLNLGSAGSDQVISNSYLTSTWQNWCVTWVKSSGTYVTYLNGVQDKTGTRTWNIPSSQTNARIGSWNHSTAREYNGKIACLKIYDKALTSTEVTKNFNAHRARFGI